MEKSTFEQMGGTYHQEGDHFLPNLLCRKVRPLVFGASADVSI